MTMGTVTLRPEREASPHDIHCPRCNKLVWSHRERVLLARVTRFPVSGPAEACCKICKTWVIVPVAKVGA